MTLSIVCNTSVYHFIRERIYFAQLEVSKRKLDSIAIHRMSTEIKNPSISSNHNLSSPNINIVDKIKTFQNIINDEKSNNGCNGSEMEQISISDYLNEFDLENVVNGSRSVVLDNSFTQNDLNKKCSNRKSVSTDSFSENENHDSHKHKRPVMGKTALLKKTNLEHTDSFIVHRIILNKYEDILNHYVNRMYKRRLSRLSSTSEDDYSEASTVPRYTSSALSSAGTYRSIPEFKKSYLEDNKKFYSIDDLNVDTPEENMNASSLTCYSHFNNRTSTSCSDYDPKKFLVNALGDLANSESGSQNCLSNTGQICDDSVGTSRLSSLLSKANSFGSLKKNKKNLKISTTDETFNRTDILEQYKKELSRQNSIIFQISKALHYCKNSKEFFIGEERLEAEKILLVATITKQALINEINTIEFDTYRTIFDPRCRGGISISNLTFNMKERIDPDQRCDYEEHFLIVLNCGRQVLSSNILKADNDVLSTVRTFSFENLLTDFEISLYVYSLLINKKDYNSQDKSKCPSPKSIFKCNKESRHFKHMDGSKTSDQIAFIPIGSCQIRNSELHKIQDGNLNLRLEQHSQSSSLQPSFQLEIETKFELTNRLSGFLTIGFNNAKNCVSWNRRWCILDAFFLKYWNYPSEETTTNPLGQIDLRFCAEEKIVQADRSVCARQKTLSLPIKDAKGSRLYFLSTDTQSDWQMWESELNFVIRSLLIWKEMKNQ